LPCSDVTEVLSVTIDHNDRLLDYALNKMTCGGAVGEAPRVKEYLKNYPLAEIINMSAEEFLSYHQTNDVLEEFFYLKHFFAVQGALKVFFGQETGSQTSPTILREVIHTETGVELFLELKIDILTEKIQSCGRCVGCGTKREIKAPDPGLPMINMA
jgi:hypothetical protein